MTTLGAVVFGGLLMFGVLWLLLTAPGEELPWADAQAVGTPETGVAALAGHSLL